MSAFSVAGLLLVLFLGIPRVTALVPAGAPPPWRASSARAGCNTPRPARGVTLYRSVHSGSEEVADLSAFFALLAGNHVKALQATWHMLNGGSDWLPDLVQNLPTKALVNMANKVVVHDARQLEQESGLTKAEFLERYGFVLLQHKSGMSPDDWTAAGRQTFVSDGPEALHEELGIRTVMDWATLTDAYGASGDAPPTDHFTLRRGAPAMLRAWWNLREQQRKGRRENRATQEEIRRTEHANAKLLDDMRSLAKVLHPSVLEADIYPNYYTTTFRDFSKSAEEEAGDRGRAEHIADALNGNSAVAGRYTPGRGVQVVHGDVAYGEGVLASGPLDKQRNFWMMTRQMHDPEEDSKDFWERRDSARRHITYGMWRPVLPMSEPLRDMPLCFCDPNTVRDLEISNSKIVIHRDDDGTPDVLPLSSSLEHSPEHKWYYYPDMTTDEVIIFRNGERNAEGSYEKPVFHTAFADPAASTDTQKRRSFEARFDLFLR